MFKKILSIALLLLALYACKKTPIDNTVPVASVSLNQTEAEMLVGETLQLQAQISPSNATDKTLMWGSSKQSVATVSDAGLVTAVAEGSSKITVTASGKTATCVVTVTKPDGPVDPENPVHVESVSLDKEDAQLEVGGTLTLVATVLPEDADDKSVTWRSTNPEIAEVDQDGNVTAISSGTVTISATTVDGAKVAACEITVSVAYIPVQSVEFEVDGISVQMGETRSLSVTVLPENATNKNITWSSTDPDVAVVDENGNMTAVGLGYTFIEATADGKTGYLYVSVMPRLESLSIEPENLTLEIGQTASVTVNVTPESVLDSYRCAYQNNNEDIIDVEETYDDLRFNITAKAAGEATFDFGVYVSGEWIIATCHVTVLFIEDEYDGETDGHKWVDLGLPSGIKWATCDVGADNSAQAGSLFAWGEIIPKDDDSAPYKWFDSATGKYLKYVLKPEFGEVDNLTTLEAEDDAARMNWGGEWRMPTLADIEELWENTTYEFVTQNGVPGGKITSKINSHSIFLPALFDTGSGNYLSSTLYDFESNSAKGLCFHMDGFGQTLLSRNKRFPVRPVLGNPPYVPVESVEFWFTHYFLDVGQIDYLSVDIIPANATNKTVTWSSSNESVAIVDQNGKLTARSVGGTYITAEVEGKRDEFYLRVSPVVHATFEPASMSLKVGESAEVTVILDPPGDLSTSGLGQSTPWIIDVQYISSNPIKFRVTGLSEGTGKFTFSANNSSYDYYVTVTKD